MEFTTDSDLLSKPAKNENTKSLSKPRIFSRSAQSNERDQAAKLPQLWNDKWMHLIPHGSGVLEDQLNPLQVASHSLSLSNTNNSPTNFFDLQHYYCQHRNWIYGAQDMVTEILHQDACTPRRTLGMHQVAKSRAIRSYGTWQGFVKKHWSWEYHEEPGGSV
jgi:hypothetical protein